jgi:phospholipase C
MTFAARTLLWTRCSVAVAIAGCAASGSAATGPTQAPDRSGNTATPIKHVIIVIGENRSFDNLFATYQPRDASQQVWNLRRKRSSPPPVLRG